MTWVGNWPLVMEMLWSDMGAFEIDRSALVLNRLRRWRSPSSSAGSPCAPSPAASATGCIRRSRPAARRRTALTAAALALPPLALLIALWALVNQGFQGATVERRHKDYWRENLTTWINQPLPYVTRVEMDIDLDPQERGLRASGFYDLQNRRPKDLDWFPVTGGSAWKELAWTLDGRPFQPEERHGLYVFRLPRPLVSGASRAARLPLPGDGAPRRLQERRPGAARRVHPAVGGAGDRAQSGLRAQDRFRSRRSASTRRTSPSRGSIRRAGTKG